MTTKGGARKTVEPVSSMSSNNYKPTLEEQHELILGERERAHKLARHILRLWNVNLEQGDLESIVGLALCEAAKGFDPGKDVKFSTYLYYFLKGQLAEAVSFHSEGPATCSIIGEESSHDESFESAHTIDERGLAKHGDFERDSGPETRAFQNQIRSGYSQAFSKLSQLERSVVIGIHLLEYKVAAVARNLGYSRGHISDVRRKALGKLRIDLVDYKEAA